MLCLHLPVHYFPAETKVGVIISLWPPASAGCNAALNGNAHPMNNVSTSDKTTCTFVKTLYNLFGKLHHHGTLRLLGARVLQMEGEFIHSPMPS